MDRVVNIVEEQQEQDEAAIGAVVGSRRPEVGVWHVGGD